MLTDDPREACVHVMPLGSISTERLRGYADNWSDTFTRVIGLRPTGWSYVAFHDSPQCLLTSPLKFLPT